MLADAVCLWIAAAPSASGVVSMRMATGPDDRSAVSAGTAKPGSRMTRRPNRCQVAHTWSGGPAHHDTSRENGTKSLPAYVASLGASEHAIHPTRPQSRSLSYLSLTLRCMAPRSGWLGGCAPLQMRQCERQMTATQARSDGPAGNNRPAAHPARMPSEKGTGSQPTSSFASRLRPVFL